MKKYLMQGGRVVQRDTHPMVGKVVMKVTDMLYRRRSYLAQIDTLGYVWDGRVMTPAEAREELRDYTNSRITRLDPRTIKPGSRGLTIAADYSRVKTAWETAFKHWDVYRRYIPEALTDRDHRGTQVVAWRRYFNRVLPVVDVEEFVKGYLDCMLFTEPMSFDDGGDDTSLMHNNYEVDDITPASRQAAASECRDFIRQGGLALRMAKWLGRPDEHLGHDFWLTRNHHGAGFWDRGLQYGVGEVLTKISHTFSERHGFLHDDTITIE